MGSVHGSAQRGGMTATVAGCIGTARPPAAAPGSLPEEGPCAGGCDACDAAKDGGGAAALERDVTDEARLLLAGLDAIRVRVFVGVCVWALAKPACRARMLQLLAPLHCQSVHSCQR